VLDILTLRKFLVSSLVSKSLSETHSRVSRVYLLMVKEPKHLISPTNTNDKIPCYIESNLSYY
jgi:hypothetical protein